MPNNRAFLQKPITWASGDAGKGRGGSRKACQSSGWAGLGASKAVIATETPRWKLLGFKDLHEINENQNAFFVLF